MVESDYYKQYVQKSNEEYQNKKDSYKNKFYAIEDKYGVNALLEISLNEALYRLENLNKTPKTLGYYEQVDIDSEVFVCSGESDVEDLVFNIKSFSIEQRSKTLYCLPVVNVNLLFWLNIFVTVSEKDWIFFKMNYLMNLIKNERAYREIFDVKRKIIILLSIIYFQ